ncbi:hypothetical protein LPJ59_002582 [Coemansia sp. RSA 2399]|nr:hypothetical protein LPJ59_002582 [Coemansia sp. RSA 2399]KAJ1903084.1 hypothetical protein LPJ81_003248 [Coemansia sp. IMI 209127]
MNRGRTASRLLLRRLVAGSCVRRAHSWTEAHRVFAKLGDNAYRILGVESTSSAAEIKQHYYKLCRELHPDTSANTKPSGLEDEEWRQMGPDARRRAVHERFVMVTGAYEVLSDPELRRKYNVHIQAERRARDPWASERPSMYEHWQRSQSQNSGDSRLLWGVFGFIGILTLVSVVQRAWQYEDMQWIREMEHLKAAHALETARERARERMREVPPGLMGEYEVRRLGRAPADVEFASLWPHGSGLGLVALLSDNQLCGLRSRQQVADDPAVARSRDAARRALACDRVVGKYLVDQPSTLETQK